MSDSDDFNDVRHAMRALENALEHHRRVREGGGRREQREQFFYWVGVARVLLGRIAERVYKPGDGRQ